MSNPDPQGYVDALSAEEVILFTFRDEIYGGKWERMLQELTDRLRGKSCVFRLVNRVLEDCARVEKMMKYEAENNVDLAPYVGIRLDREAAAKEKRLTKKERGE
jgi:hypothetical protein